MVAEVMAHVVSEMAVHVMSEMEAETACVTKGGATNGPCLSTSGPEANQDVQSAGRKIAELEKKLNKKQTIKRVIDEKITEVLENIEENKDSESVDKEGTDVVKDIYEK